MIEQKLIYILDLIGTASFAFSGAIRALDRRPDLVGITILAGATAIGGGMVRDLLLQRHVAMLWDVNYLGLILAAAIVTFLLPRALSHRKSFFKYFDAVGLGIFSAIGAQLAWSMSGEMQTWFVQHVGLGWYPAINPLSVLFIACITGAGGGIIRDVLLNEMPLVLYKEVYILAVALGAAALMLIRGLGGNETVAFLAAMVITTTVRVLAIRFDWSLPRVELRPPR